MNDPVPQIALKTHLDGDPCVRPDELEEWDAVRRRYALLEMLVLILTPSAPASGALTDAMPAIDGGVRAAARSRGSFNGFDMHGWVIRERDGVVVCEPEQIDITIVPDQRRSP